MRVSFRSAAALLVVFVTGTATAQTPNNTSWTFSGGNARTTALVIVDHRVDSRLGGSDTAGSGAGFFMGTSGGDYAGMQMSSNYDIDFWTFNSGWYKRMVLTNAGSLGVGATAPSNLLHVRDAQSSTSTAPPSWVGLRVERSANTAAAGLAVQGGTKASGGRGRIFLGNAD